MITAQVLKDLPSSDFQYISGPLDKIASRVLPPELCHSDSLVFVSKLPQLEMALHAKAPIIIAHNSLTLPNDFVGTIFTTQSISGSMATILPLFDGKMNRFNQAEKVHSTAVVHETAHIGKNVGLGPHVVVGEKAYIGDNCTIGANTVIENEARIGDYTLIHPLVFIGSHCEVGSHCEIHPHTTIGADGFAFTMAADGTHRKIPQIGRVVIEDHVELGANCAIDRAALTETRIGRGTKMDNFCHIAHNCTIGKDNVLAAKFSIAGSSTLGSNCMAGGEAAISDHMTVTDKVILGGRAGVTSNILKSGAYGGYPVEPLRDAMKTLANLTHLTHMRKQINRIVKHLGLNEE